MTEFTQEAVKKLSAGLNEPDWMLAFRLDAFAQFEQMPMPDTSDEAWRRTNIRRLKMNQISPSVNGDAAIGATVPEFLGKQLTVDKAGGNMLQVDGMVQQFALSDELKEQVMNIADELCPNPAGEFGGDSVGGEGHSIASSMIDDHEIVTTVIRRQVTVFVEDSTMRLKVKIYGVEMTHDISKNVLTFVMTSLKKA